MSAIFTAERIKLWGTGASYSFHLLAWPQETNQRESDQLPRHNEESVTGLPVRVQSTPIATPLVVVSLRRAKSECGCITVPSRPEHEKCEIIKGSHNEIDRRHDFKKPEWCSS